MGASAERIALDITATSNVAEVAKARSEISALGQAAIKAGSDSTAAWQAAATAVNVQIGAYERLGKVIDKTNLGAVASYRALGVELKENLFQLQATESEINRIDAAMVRLERSAGAATVAVGASENAGLTGSSRRVQGAFIGAAFALDAFTRSTDAGEGATRRLLRSVSLLGFAFGPEVGIITTAVSSIGDAIFEEMTRSAKATEQQRIEFEKLLETVSRRGYAASSEVVQQLYSGDPFARRGAVKDETEQQFQIRRRGLQGLEQEMAKLKAVQQDSTDAWDRAQIAIRALQPILDQQNARYQEALILQKAGLAVVQDRARFELQQMQDRASRRATPTLPVDLSARGRGAFGTDTLSNIGVDYEGLSLMRQLRGEELELEVQLHRTNLTYKERLELYKQLGEVQQKIAGYGEVDTSKIKIHAAAIPPDIWNDPVLRLEALWEQATKRLAENMAEGISGTLSDVLSDAFTGSFKKIGEDALGGFGGILTAMGGTLIQFGVAMEGLDLALANPFTSGIAAIGVGILLEGLGKALGATAHSHGGAGGGSAAAYGGTFTPSAVSSGGGVTVIIQTVDPTSKAVINQTAYELNRARMLNTPIVVPYGRPS